MTNGKFMLAFSKAFYGNKKNLNKAEKLVETFDEMTSGWTAKQHEEIESWNVYEIVRNPHVFDEKTNGDFSVYMGDFSIARWSNGDRRFEI